MIEYLKLVILALVCGITMPLPASSAAHFSVLSYALNFAADETNLGFYYSVFGIVFSVVIFIMLRKIYIKSLSALFTRNEEKLKSNKLTPYKPIVRNIFLSLIPMAVLFIPVSGDTLVLDYFDKFLTSNSLYLVGVASVINALILLVAIWYTRQKANELKRVSDTRSTLRMAVYQVVSYVVPGFSHIASGSVNMLISDVNPRVIIREVYLYLAPHMFIISVFKVVRAILNDVIVDLVPLTIAIVVFALAAFLCVHLVGKFNLRKLFPFFAVYSVLIGALAVAATFII